MTVVFIYNFNKELKNNLMQFYSDLVAVKYNVSYNQSQLSFLIVSFFSIIVKYMNCITTNCYKNA